MKKTLMIAAALLTFGASSAFAGEDFYDRFPVETHAPAAQQASASQQQASMQTQPASKHNLLFPSSTRQTTSVYAIFTAPGSTQGGSQ